jgi:hypothetical protein
MQHPAAEPGPGALVGRLVDIVEQRPPQVRAVATTLLIKALDLGGDQELALITDLVGSDPAAVIIDRDRAAAAGQRLREGLRLGLVRLSATYGEAAVARAMRDHLDTQLARWATTAVDDADNRRRAERFLAWAERPDQLEAAQARGLFAGMGVEEFRRLAETRLRSPVAVETAVELWSSADAVRRELVRQLGEEAIATWQAAQDP